MNQLNSEGSEKKVAKELTSGEGEPQPDAWYGLERASPSRQTWFLPPVYQLLAAGRSGEGGISGITCSLSRVRWLSSTEVVLWNDTAECHGSQSATVETRVLRSHTGFWVSLMEVFINADLSRCLVVTFHTKVSIAILCVLEECFFKTLIKIHSHYYRTIH